MDFIDILAVFIVLIVIISLCLNALQESKKTRIIIAYASASGTAEYCAYTVYNILQIACKFNKFVIDKPNTLNELLSSYKKTSDREVIIIISSSIDAGFVPANGSQFTLRNLRLKENVELNGALKRGRKLVIGLGDSVDWPGTYLHGPKSLIKIIKKACELPETEVIPLVALDDKFGHIVNCNSIIRECSALIDAL